MPVAEAIPAVAAATAAAHAAASALLIARLSPAGALEKLSASPRSEPAHRTATTCDVAHHDQVSAHGPRLLLGTETPITGSNNIDFSCFFQCMLVAIMCEHLYQPRLNVCHHQHFDEQIRVRRRLYRLRQFD